MRLPSLFLQIHQREIEASFHKYGPIFRIIPKEPLGAVIMDSQLLEVENLTVTVVTIRCVNDHGALRAEAFSEPDMIAARQWAEKHRNTPVEDFTWFPSFDRRPDNHA